MQRLIIGLLCVLSITGCNTTPENKLPEVDPGKFTGLIAFSIATARITPDPPDDSPSVPDGPVTVIRTKDCTDCLDLYGRPQGYVGDGTIKTDCGTCDFNGDGDVDDPASLFGDDEATKESPKKLKTAWGEAGSNPRSETTEDPTPEFKPEIELEDIVEPKVAKATPKQSIALTEINWLFDSVQAIEQAQSSGKHIFVVLDNKLPESDFWKSPIIVKYLTENYICLYGDTSNKEVAAAWAKNGVPASGKPLVPVTISKGKPDFSGEALCVLTSDGKFMTKNAVNVFWPIPKEPLVMLDLVDDYVAKFNKQTSKK